MPKELCVSFGVLLNFSLNRRKFKGASEISGCIDNNNYFKYYLKCEGNAASLEQIYTISYSISLQFMMSC